MGPVPDSNGRTLFRVAALFNLAAALPFLVATRPVGALMGLEITPTSTLFIQITMGVVVLFGWAYWMIFTDPVRYRPYVLLGILGKAMIIAFIWGHWFLGDLSWPLPALASIDILFAGLFWRYYQRTRGPVAA